jgi:hypothetical protein
MCLLLLLQEATLADRWTTFPSRETPDPYVEPPFLEEIREQDGAGPAATVKHGSWLNWLQRRWGYPIYPEEPVSLSTALMQRGLSEQIHRYRLWYGIEERTGLPIAARTRAHLEGLLEIMWSHMISLLEKEIPTVYSIAKDAAQLDELQTAPPPTGRIDYKALKDRIDIVSYIERYTTLKKMGVNYRGVCPLHSEKTPSLYVYPKTKSFYCFGCQRGGDVIDFAKAIGVDKLE